MGTPDYPDALQILRRDAGASLHRALAAACEPVPAWDPVVYMIDFAREMLFPLAAGVAGEHVAATMAGRAFTTGQPVSAGRDGPVRLWVPMMEQTTRTGVLAITVPHASPQIVAHAELLGVFAGLAAAAATRVSDLAYLRRRGQAMSLSASMQWDLLPPLSARTGGAVIAGGLEPAYDIAGDAFDYAADGSDLHFAIIDGLGHGLSSTLLTGLTVGAYRHARRGGATLPGIHQAMDAALTGYYDDVSFATGIIGRLATGSGRLEWSCAGHPRPLLLRDRKVVAELDCPSVLPFGLADGPPAPRTEELQPGDAVLLYTDGVVEARTPDGELFGLDRLTDLLEREAASGQAAEEILRRLLRAVLDHQAGGLRDDATLLLVQWMGNETPDS
jgi:serine phosphatase RsbU (regulator of sigma subunit)